MSPSGPPSPNDSLEEVTVNGSRLWLDPTEAVAPVIVLDRRDIERRGENSIGDVLQALPQNAGSLLNTNLNNGAEPYGDGGNGTVRLALRGHATLVLVNGRRFPNSGEGADASVDLNTLPISLVDRVEVLASGASAIYGSDAVGGVVNIVTRRDMVGFTVAGSQTLSEHGDGPVTTGQAAAGLDLFGGTWILGVDHVEQEGVTLDRRDYSAVPLGSSTATGRWLPSAISRCQRVSSRCRRETRWDSRPVCTRASTGRPDAAQPTTGRSTPPRIISTLRPTTICRRRTSAAPYG